MVLVIQTEIADSRQQVDKAIADSNARAAAIEEKLAELGVSMQQKISATEELLTTRLTASEQSLGTALETKIKMLVEAVTKSRAGA